MKNLIIRVSDTFKSNLRNSIDRLENRSKVELEKDFFDKFTYAQDSCVACNSDLKDFSSFYCHECEKVIAKLKR